MTDLPLPVRLSGAVWGHLVGDAMGVPYEFREPGAIGEVRWGERGTHGKPAETWSDDGALMLSLLDSLLTVGFDPEDQGRRALDWRRNGAYTPDGDVFDIGIATAGALDRLAAGTPAEEAGASGDRSASNGSLMRILPLALWAHGKSSRDELIDLALRASSVTHRHAACRVACAILVLVVDGLLAGTRPEEALASALRDAADGRTPRAEDELPAALEELRAWPESHEPQGRGGALDAFWSAWTAFAGATDYRQTIERAIAYGRDTDTTAAIAGGLAGTRWGIDRSLASG